MADTRQSKRTPVTLKIKFKSETLDQFIERYAVDVSHGGIFIRTKDPLPVGTTMRFEFQLKDASPLIKGAGTVVWTREHDPSRTGVAPGMGVRFDRLGEGSREVLDQILARKAMKTSSTGFTDMPTRVAPSPLVSNLAQRTGQSRTSSSSFSEDANSPPAPTPFFSDADQFPEEAFEEATKVRSMEDLALLSKKEEDDDERASSSSGPTLRRPDSEGPTRLVSNPLLADVDPDAEADSETSFADLNEPAQNERAETVRFDSAGLGLDGLAEPTLDRHHATTTVDADHNFDDILTEDQPIRDAVEAPESARTTAFSAALARSASSSETTDADLIPDPLAAPPTAGAQPDTPRGLTDALESLDAQVGGVVMEDDEPTAVRKPPTKPPDRVQSKSDEDSGPAALPSPPVGRAKAESDASADDDFEEEVLAKTLVKGDHAKPPIELTEKVERAKTSETPEKRADESESEGTNTSMTLALAAIVLIAVIAGVYFMMTRGGGGKDKKSTTEQPVVLKPIDAAPKRIDAAPRVDAAPPDAAIDAGIDAMAIPPDAEMVQVTVRSSPSGSDAVLVGTDQSGKTPLVVTVAKGVTYKVRLTREGYQSQEIEIDGTRAKTRRTKMQLIPIILRITTEPPGAYGYVDGRRVPGVTPTDFALPLSFRDKEDMKVALRLSGYEKLDIIVQNRDHKVEGETKVIEVSGTFQPKAGKTPGAGAGNDGARKRNRDRKRDGDGTGDGGGASKGDGDGAGNDSQAGAGDKAADDSVVEPDDSEDPAPESPQNP